MTNQHEHKFDFTEKHYRALLRLAKFDHRFVFYDEIQLSEKIILWRHDLDFSVHRALKLAQIESDEGIKATYFVHLHSEFYNWWEKDIADKLREILGLGHRLGLHFEPAFYKNRIRCEKDILKWLSWEKQIMEVEFNQEISVFSFHNPDVGGDWLNHDTDSMAGMVNTSGRMVRNNFICCSDSNGYWRFKRLWDVLENAGTERIHVLTHPGWWQKKIFSPRERIFRSAFGRAKATMNSYDSLLTSECRENLTENGSRYRFYKK